MSVPSVRMGAAVRALVAPRLTRGLHVPLGQGRSMPRGSGAPVLTLQVSGALMTSWGSDEVETAARGVGLAGGLTVGLGRGRDYP
jgi:hypothetical protein